MRTLRAVLARVRGLFAGPKADRELTEELELHVELAAAELQRRGMSAADARRTALLDFGGVTRATEAYRAQRGLPTLSGLWNDARWSARSLARNPLFTAATLLTLTVGVGSTTAMLHIVDRAILHPVPYPDADRFVYLGWTWAKGGNATGLSAREFEFWHENSRVFTGVATTSKFAASIGTIADADDAAPLNGLSVTTDFFRALGIAPSSGRAFATDEYANPAAPVVILSNAVWHSRFAGDPRIVGRTIRVSGAPTTVVGVMPSRFDLAGQGEHADLLEPLALSPTDLTDHGNNYDVIARIDAGVTPAAVRADMQRVFLAYQHTFPDAVAADDRGVLLISYATRFIGSYERVVWILFAATVFLFLLACANVTNLLLVRTVGQRAQFAVCLALGAGRLRVMSRVVIEAAMLGVAAAGLAVVASQWTLRGLLALSSQTFLLDERRMGLDWRVALIMSVLTVAAMAAIGFAVALSATRIDLASGLADAGRRRSASRPQQRVTGWLVGLQTALASVLLIGATLLIASFAHLLGINAGFARDGIVTATLARVPAGYDSAAAVNQFTARMLDLLRRDPSIATAAATSSLPLQRGWNIPMELTDRPDVGEGAPEWRAVSPQLFGTYGISVLRGRGFTDADEAGSAPVVVVSQSFAATYWPGGDPIGQRITIGTFRGRLIGPKFADAPRTVVGVVPDLRDMSLEQHKPRHTMWIPLAQVPAGMTASRLPSFVVRARDVRAATAALHDALTEADPRLRNVQVATMNAIVEDSLASRRFNMILMAAFAAIALLLTCVGVYGVVAYGVSRRTSEIGIRMALGASPGGVTLMVVRQGMRPVVLGLIAGFIASVAVRGYLASLAYEIKPSDPRVLSAAGVLILGVAIVANYLPARRAARTNPAAALRVE
jgi:predicted permease